MTNEAAPTAPKLIGLAAMAAIGIWGVWTLNELRLRGLAPQWITLTFCLVALSAVVGGLAALRTNSVRVFSPFFWGLLVQVLGSLVVVAFTMGGGATAWTIGFWKVSAVGWFSGYVWFFITIGLLISLFRGAPDGSN
jgi:hypothetical protein